MNQYNEIAEGYNALHGEEQLNKAKIILDNIIINKNDRLLDVGCGTGIATNLFPCNKTGIDPAEKLLEKCSFPTKKAKAEDLPFKDSEFDIVISLTVIHHCNMNKALDEMFRVSKRDIIVSVLKKSKAVQEIKDYPVKPYKEIEEDHDIIFFFKKFI